MADPSTFTQKEGESTSPLCLLFLCHFFPMAPTYNQQFVRYRGPNGRFYNVEPRNFGTYTSGTTQTYHPKRLNRKKNVFQGPASPYNSPVSVASLGSPKAPSRVSSNPGSKASSRYSTPGTARSFSVQGSPSHSNRSSPGSKSGNHYVSPYHSPGPVYNLGSPIPFNNAALNAAAPKRSPIRTRGYTKKQLLGNRTSPIRLRSRGKK